MKSLKLIFSNGVPFDFKSRKSYVKCIFSMANKMKYKKKKSLVTFLSKRFGFGDGLKDVMSGFLGLNIRFRRILRLRAKHILIVKRKTILMRSGSSKKKDIRERILVLIRIKSYRGMRHKMKHPSRGQRTHTNGKTKKKFRY